MNSFEDFFTTKLDIISIHRPGVFLENNNRKLPGCSHTYEDRFFKDIVYLSDSGGKDVSEDLNYSFLAKLFAGLPEPQKEKIFQVLRNTRTLEKTG